MAEDMPTRAATAELAKVVRPGKFEFAKVHFFGGLLRKSMPMTTKKVIVSNGEKIFVKMLATEPWLIGAVTGQKAHCGLGRTTLLAMLHSFVGQACNGELDTPAAAEEDGDEYDPMQEIEVDDGTHSRSREGGRPLEAHWVSTE